MSKFDEKENLQTPEGRLAPMDKIVRERKRTPILKKKYIFTFIIIIMGLCCLAQKGICTIESEKANQYPPKAVIAYNNARFTEAVKEYKRRADNGALEGYLNLAIIFKELGHYSKAINILNNTFFKFSNDSRVLSLLGRLYYLNNQPDEAIVILKRILELKPDDIDANINLGLCYQDKAQDAEAQKYFEKTLALNRNNVVAHLSLADLYYRKEKLLESINEYKEVSLIDASIIRIQKMLGEIFLKIGNLEEALKIFQRIRLIEPGNKLIEARINEISAKIGKEYFEKERQRTAGLRKQKTVLVKPLPPIKNVVYVRVGLMQEENSVGFKCSGPFEIKMKVRGLSVFRGLEGESYLLSKSDARSITISNQKQENTIIDGPAIIRPLNPNATITLFSVKLGRDNFWAAQQDRSYRGSIEISSDRGGINVINIINLEEYLYSLVPAEMPKNWPREALKAQAVAARTEAMAKLGRHKAQGFDFCPEVHCQSYTGVEQETELTNQAVDETRGIIMFYQGKPIDAVYSSNCGGHTQDNIFGRAEYIPYLKATFDTLQKQNTVFPLSPLELEYWLKEPPKGILCDIPEYQKSSNFRWVRIYTVQELNEMLNKIANIGEVAKIVVLKRQKSGHISKVKIIGSKSSYILEKELDIRKALGNLRSSMFKVEIKYNSDKKPQQFIFYGGGWGHGVGMCQSGACGMANQGKNYKEILNHYFQGIEFKKVY